MFRTFIILIICLALTSCFNSNTLSIDSNKNSESKEKIRELFLNWQNQEIKNKHFLAADSCNPDWFAEHGTPENLDSINGLIFGFPSDSSEYTFSFADLNNDNNLDCLVLFTPNQCDGGNASMWVQWQVFIISDKDSYKIIDTLHIDKFAHTEFDSLGFYWLDSIAVNRIHGTYIEFKENDGHCCPSINRPVVFDYSERKLICVGANIERK
jgi:hypothetical protein